jgi:hypothetical protein
MCPTLGTSCIYAASTHKKLRIPCIFVLNTFVLAIQIMNKFHVFW